LGGDGLEPSCFDFFMVLVDLSSDGRFFRSLAAPPPPPPPLLLACKKHMQKQFNSAKE